MSVGRKAIVSALWTSGANYFALFVGFIFGLMRDRVMMPAENGIYMYGLAVVDLVFILAGISINLSVIQATDEREDLYSTAFVLTIALAVFMGIACAVTGYLLLARGTLLIKVQAFLFLAAFSTLNLFTLLFSAYIEKQIDYRRIATVNMISVIAFPLLSYLLVLNGWGAWGMLWGNAASFLVSFVGMILISRYPIGLRFNRDTAKWMLSMGWKLIFSRGMEVVFVRYGTIVTESLLGTTLQGSYGRALKYWELAPQTVSPSVVTVAMPTYSKVQNDPEKLSQAFSIVLFFLVRVLLPFVLVFAVIPSAFINIIGRQWQDAVPVLRILAIGALLSPLFENMKVLLYAKGKPELMVRVRIMQLLIFVPAMYLLVGFYGVSGAAMAVSLNLILGVAGVGIYVRREVSIAWKENVILPVLFAGVATGAVMLLPVPQLGWGAVVQFGVEAVWLVGLFVVLEAVFEFRQIRERFRYIKSVMKKQPAADES
jgi:O-antigen/teichoic acid export membrane protein